MDDDDEIQSHASSTPNGRITVTVAAAPPPPPPSSNCLTLALPIQHQKASASGSGGGREDCWSEGATAVLIDAWGERYLELSRGNLKQKHWKEVADIVSSRDDYTKTPKTDIQCKNRIDTVKKKYKIEKAKIASGGGPSSWRFFDKLDELIGPAAAKINSTTPPPADANNAYQRTVPMGIPVGVRSSTAQHQKPNRKRPPVDSDGESEPDNSADSSDGLPPESFKRPRIERETLMMNDATGARPVVGLIKGKGDGGNAGGNKEGTWRNSMRELTRAILKFGEVYEQAETAKLQQLVEIEKQRMKFAKELELQRMQYFMKTQLEISQLKNRRHGNNNNHREINNNNDATNNNNNNNNNTYIYIYIHVSLIKHCLASNREKPITTQCECESRAVVVLTTMQFRVLILCVLTVAAATGGAAAHNITQILAKHPGFSTFSHYLTVTHLADEINRRRTITVCAVDNGAMNDLLARHFSIATIKNVLSLHIFADYFGAKKLHQITRSSTTTSSLFQATGEAAGTSGYVNITDMKGGKVGFSPVDSEGSEEGRPMATFVKSLQEIPYVIAVIQISHILSSPEAEAPAASPTDMNVTTIMARQGCQEFADLVNAQPDAKAALQHSVESGLTVFCPADEALDEFAPDFKNLTADEKVSLILYHAVPEYNSLGMLRSSNGLMNTLATEGAKRKYDFTVQNVGDNVKLKTKVVTATITGTLIDADPFAVYKIDKVLLPKELFKEAPLSPAPAPKPSKPKKSKSKSANAGGSGDEEDDAGSPGPSGDDDGAVADEDSSNDGRRVAGGGTVSVLFSLAIAIFAFIF